MLIQLLIIVIPCVVHNADCKRNNREVLQAKIVNVRKHVFQCPRNSFIVGFNMNNERVHCRKFDEPAEKRNSKICKWCRKCYNSDGGNQENFRIARGLRFVFKKSRNLMAKKLVKRVQLYCCKQDCESFDCKLKLFYKPVIETHLKKMNFINYAIYEKWENVLKTEFCRPRCLPIAQNDTSISGGDLDGNGGEDTDQKGLETAATTIMTVTTQITTTAAPTSSYCQRNNVNHLGCFCGKNDSLCPKSFCHYYHCYSHWGCSTGKDSCDYPMSCNLGDCTCMLAGLKLERTPLEQRNNTCCSGFTPDASGICRTPGVCFKDVQCLRWDFGVFSICDVCVDGRCVKNKGESCEASSLSATKKAVFGA